jgi:hypothetical protein
MRAAIDLLLPYLYHPRIPISFLLERLTMLKRARYIVATYVGAIAVAVLLVTPCLLQAQQTPINPDVMGSSNTGTSALRATVPHLSRECRETRTSGMWARSQAGFLRARMAGGIHWNPIFDSEPVTSIGSLAVAASDPNIVWA